MKISRERSRIPFIIGLSVAICNMDFATRRREITLLLLQPPPPAIPADALMRIPRWKRESLRDNALPGTIARRRRDSASVLSQRLELRFCIMAYIIWRLKRNETRKVFFTVALRDG